MVGVNTAPMAVFTGAGAPLGAAVGDLADAGWLERTDGRAEGFFAEEAGGTEGGVANDFGFESLALELGGGAGVDERFLLVGRGGDDEAMELFERPIIFD